MLESMVLSVPLWPKGVGPTDAPIICTYNSHVNETLYAKNSVVHMVNGRACAELEGIRLYICYQHRQHDYRSHPL